MQLVEREEAHPRVIGLAAQHAVQFDRMADRFVNLQPELRAVQNQVEFAFGTLFGGVQRHRLLGDARSVLHQAQLVHQFVPLQLILAAEGIRVRALLNLAILVAQRRKARAGQVARLVDRRLPSVEAKTCRRLSKCMQLRPG